MQPQCTRSLLTLLTLLSDLVEMTKGVQHPTRGLFLRYYLSEKTKDKLPDLHSDYEGHGGTVADAISFVLQNFAEMTRLWVRMQFNHAVRNRKRRERQRQELRELVGSNLVRLSQMEGVDLPMYQSTVLPRVLEQVTNSKDKIAQFYIMEIVGLVFPDEFHIRTLETYLSTCQRLLPGVDVKVRCAVMVSCAVGFASQPFFRFCLFCVVLLLVLQSLVVSLMTRIADFARRTTADNSAAEPIPASIPAFDIFRTFCDTLCTERRESLTPVAVLELLAGLLDFTTQCYPALLNNVDGVLASAAAALETLGSRCVPRAACCCCCCCCSLSLIVLPRAPVPSCLPAFFCCFLFFPSGKLDVDATDLVTRLLTLPQTKLSLRVLELPHYPRLMEALDYSNRRVIARSLLKAVLASKTRLQDAAMVRQLLTFLAPIIKDADGAPSEEEDIKEEFEEEQHNVARLLHLVDVSDAEKAFQVLQAVREHFGFGGTRRIPFTLPPLVFTCLRLLQSINAGGAASGAGAAAAGSAGAGAGAGAAPSATAATRRLLTFVHEICTALASSQPELAVSLFLQVRHWCLVPSPPPPLTCVPLFLFLAVLCSRPPWPPTTRVTRTRFSPKRLCWRKCWTPRRKCGRRGCSSAPSVRLGG